VENTHVTSVNLLLTGYKLQNTGFCFAKSIKAPLCKTLDFALQHPSKLRFENKTNKKTLKQAWRFFL